MWIFSCTEFKKYKNTGNRAYFCWVFNNHSWKLYNLLKFKASFIRPFNWTSSKWGIIMRRYVQTLIWNMDRMPNFYNHTLSNCKKIQISLFNRLKISKTPLNLRYFASYFINCWLYWIGSIDVHLTWLARLLLELLFVKNFVRLVDDASIM